MDLSPNYFRLFPKSNPHSKNAYFPLLRIVEDYPKVLKEIWKRSSKNIRTRVASFFLCDNHEEDNYFGCVVLNQNFLEMKRMIETCWSFVYVVLLLLCSPTFLNALLFLWTWDFQLNIAARRKINYQSLMSEVDFMMDIRESML